MATSAFRRCPLFTHATPKTLLSPDSMKKPNQTQLAERLGVTRQTLSAWHRNEGLDLSDLEAVEARAARARDRKETSEDLASAKLRKLKAEADRQETLAAREKGELVLAAGIEAEGQAVGLAVRQALEKLAIELPPLLAGRDAAEVSKLLRREIRAALVILSDRPAVSKLIPAITQ